MSDDLEFWEFGGGDEDHTLADLVSRVLDRGVVIVGDVTISVAGVDLVYLGLNAVLTSVATAREQFRNVHVGPPRTRTQFPR
jgi:gas vesicle structural protein